MLKTQIMLDLNTGHKTVVNSHCETLKQYFTSLNILNRSAHIYGVVYQANEKVLEGLN